MPRRIAVTRSPSNQCNAQLSINSVFVYTLLLATFSVVVVIRCDNQSISVNSHDDFISAPNDSNQCSKCTTGQTISTLIVNQTSAECLTGHYYPVLINTKCDCQFVCARESHQACRLSHQTHPLSLESICDQTLNLHCDEETNLCQGDLSLHLFDISHDSLWINWTLPRDSESSLTQVSIAEYNAQHANDTHFAPIKKLNENSFSAKIENVKPNTTYIVKVAHLDDVEFAIFRTKEQLIETLPKVLVTHRNSSSISIAFDDFKPSSYDSGYAIHYRQINLDQEKQWTVIKSNRSPFFVLANLYPNTRYQIQVSTWSTFDEQTKYKSEIIDASTLDGCIFENKTFDINDRVLSDCDQLCTCIQNGNLFCTERCGESHISVKIAKAKNLECVPHATDECCVRCPSLTNDTKKFVDKPGICPSVLSLNTTCATECAHDYHCTGIEKCCKNGCGKLSCQTPVNSSINVIDCPFKCGTNSVCRFIEDESIFRCVCLEGFFSDEPIHGCFEKPSRLHQCDFEQKTYHIGQSFEHNCDICLCSEALEVECKPKCAQFNQTLVPNNCRLVEDPSDPLCCKKKICQLPLPDNSTLNKTIVRQGCVHLNHTYSINETFFVDCELKCLCKANEQVECSPRCYEDPGYNENYCFFRPDPDDPECCKISICNQNMTVLKENFLIEMAESVNSTTIKLVVLLNISTENNNVFLFYKKIHPNESHLDDFDAEWKNQTLTKKMISNTIGHANEIMITDLQPETDYSFYFKFKDDVTNTVVVRTFPPGIDHTFTGCFHGGQIIEVGEVFDSDCDYKCICREGNLRECVERCPAYVDLIGYENCHWQPSPDDPCCTIPVCKEEHHSLECITDDGKRFKEGDTWTVGFGCLKKSCKCLLGKENTTEVNCKAGCPEIPMSVLEPSPECPSPQVVHTKDPCVCQYVVCSNNINPLDLPEKQLQSAHNKDHCEYKGDNISIGERFYDNCRAICQCEVGGSLDCQPIQCNHNFGPHTISNCLEWDIDPHFIPTPPNCCPEPKCKNDGSCSFAGIRFSNHKHIPHELLPCGQRCVCNNGEIVCENMCQEIPEKPPLNLPCPPSLAFRGHLPGDNCCLHWQCRNIYQDKIKGNCVYNDKRYKLGEQWDETETEIKRRCQCKITSGIFHVVCNPGNCQPITERFLEPNSDCQTPTVVVPKDAIMCPYVICNNTKQSGGELENVDIVAINATSARIRFTIPPLYVGLLGHAEVSYTTDMNIPRSQWNIQKFARPKRLFDIPNIEYHLGNLNPDTTYFLQVEIVVEALKTGPLSEVYRVYLPPLPVTPPSTTTTTTSTLPPIIMLDMNLSVQLIDSTSVKVSWRPFTTQEKKFMDGLQIRYRKVDGDEEWVYSQILHRNINSFVIHSLQPGFAYTVDLVFTSIDGINSNIVSNKQAIINIPGLPKDEFQFDLHIFPDDVTINDGHVDIEVRNLPTPVSKFVNVAKVYYQNMDTSEIIHDYVNIDESGKFSFSNLHSNTRYKVWVDFYLTNGHVISSNSVEIITSYSKSRPYEENTVGALMSGHLASSKYLITFMLVSLFVFLAGAGFMVVTCIFIRRHSAAAITRVCISEAAYDNPTYKTFEPGEKCMEDSLSKSNTLPAK